MIFLPIIFYSNYTKDTKNLFVDYKSENLYLLKKMYCKENVFV